MKTVYIHITKMTFLVIVIFSAYISFAQITLEQKQRITLNEYTGPLLSLQNNDSLAFTEMSFSNDAGQAFSIGISGSQNLFFNKLTSTPYIFNGTGNNFQFRSGTDEEFAFFMGDTCITLVNNYGLHVNAGRPLMLRNGHEINEIVTGRDGNIYLIMNSSFLKPDTVISIGDDNKFLGINTTSPKSQFHINQSGLLPTPPLGNFVSNFYGVRVNDWSLAENTNNRLAFIYKDLYLAYVDPTTGAYVNASDRRLKENITYLGNVLESIKKLKPAMYNYKNGERSTIGFVAQEVEKIFPNLVFQNDDHKALAYDDFAVLAIKAIQELTDKVEALEKQLSNQKNQ